MTANREKLSATGRSSAPPGVGIDAARPSPYRRGNVMAQARQRAQNDPVSRLHSREAGMPDDKLISADSHVSEPPDLWVTRVDKTYRDRAPRLVTDLPDKPGAYFLYAGHAPHPIGIGLGAGKSPEELKEFLTKATYADARPGGWDPAERIKD